MTLATVFAGYFVIASAAVIFTLGAIHLLYTFKGIRLHPRDPALTTRMQEVSPQISQETTMWRAWIGFNASHSYGALLFGLVYGYLALLQRDFLFGSSFLLAIGAVFLSGYVFLGQRYWFSVPYRGVLLATALFAIGILAGRA
jgi:hypothetical protein